MATNEVILQKTQAGLETVRGTSVAATRKLYAQVAMSYDRPIGSFEDRSGTYEARRRIMYGREVIGLTATDIATYEDLPWWGQMAWKGNVAGVSDAGTPAPAYTYDQTPSAAVDDLKSATFEVNEPGNPYEIDQVMVNSWTLRGDSDSDDEPGWMFEAEMLGRTLATTTYTAAIPDRDTEVILARGTKLFIDDATLGTTQVLGKLISFSVTGNNAIHFKAFAENEAGFAANKVGRQARTVDAQFVMEFDSDAEFAKYRSTSPSKRYVRLEREGSTIHTTVKKRARLNMIGYWSAISWGDREGNIIATFGLSCFYDTTAGYAFSPVIVNALATLP